MSPHTLIKDKEGSPMRALPKDLKKVAIYLRKSRADIESESKEEGETLSRHKNSLLEIAKKNNYHIQKIYEEIVSGERIEDRPEIIKLLQEVEIGTYQAILCMDIDRLGRGDMRDQGTIIATFKESKTLIITPNKCYDLEDEFDEEYSEFEAFIARRELKIITKRLQRGRVASVKEGKYIGTRPPYGYDREDNLVLKPNDKAEIVKMIFQWYVREGLGTGRIASRLNEMNIPSPGDKTWAPFSVNSILKNEVYTGKIQWKKTYRDKKKGIRFNRPKEEWVSVIGKHSPIIDPELFNEAEYIMKGKKHAPNKKKKTMMNPLAGLLFCKKCHSAMVRRPYQKQLPHLVCSNTSCNNKSTRLAYIERELLTQLQKCLQNYPVQMEKIKDVYQQIYSSSAPNQSLLIQLEKQLLDTEKQKKKVYDFLERGIYDEETFRERYHTVIHRINELKESIQTMKMILEKDEQDKKDPSSGRNYITIRNILDAYYYTDEPERKNNLLKQIVKKAFYEKEKDQTGDEFSLEVQIFLPEPL